MDQLRSDFESLMSELNDLSLRNDELMSAKDSDLVVIQNLDAQLKEYKKKYEMAKTELRSFKGLQLLRLGVCMFRFL
jgi:archaellum component FlaC